MAEQLTKEEVSNGYEKLLWAQGLVQYVRRMGAELEEAESISIFAILEDYLCPAVGIMDLLDMGSKKHFTALWDKKAEGQAK
jgi:hypothetical protein